MVGEEEDADPTSRGRKLFWRSASWSSSRTVQQSPVVYYDPGKDCADPNSSDKGSSNGEEFRRFPVPLTPRSQQNCKARACLPPLQPLSIVRRSLDEWPRAGSDDIGEWNQPPTPSGKPREGLKLDLSSFQKNPDSTGNFVNRDRIAFFDKECSKVADHIYLGGEAVARNRDILRQNGITHVLNCVGFVCPEYFKSDLVYKTLWLQDSPSEDITSILYDVFDYFEDVREQGGKVLVHCCQGVSRSTSLVIAYLMWREGQSFDDAFQYVKAARGIANPNMGFACQLLQCQKRVHAIPLSPSSLLRVYRMAPHTPYDPLHLVPKMLNDPSPYALDSRGAFIIHVPSAIYVWIGKNCEPIMQRDARGAAFQVVRYERVQGPILILEEGEETPEFWDVFCNHPAALDKSVNKVKIDTAAKICPGERKVDAYSVDFELFKKAITGGIVPPFSSSESEHETHLPARESNWSVLRRKCALGSTKDVVPSSKASLCRVYSDSMLIVVSESRLNKILSLPTNSWSPSSLSSDSSNSSTLTSDSSLFSPSTSSSSLLSTIKSIHPIPNSGDAVGVNNTLRLCSEKLLSPSKRFALSLAQRRGSLSTSLKLPVGEDNLLLPSRRVKTSTALVNQLDGFNAKNKSLDLPHDNQVLDLKGKPANGEEIESVCNKGAFVETVGEPQRKNRFQGGSEFSFSTPLVETDFNVCSPRKPLVWRWPGLEKVEAFCVGDLDSGSALLFLASNIGVERYKDRMLYLWIGKSFKDNNSKNQLNKNGDVSGVEEVDWNEVGCDIFSMLGLPKDIPVKVRTMNQISFTELLHILSLKISCIY
ncbi:hypothetical protein GIB67_014212 [Kingdonia uniflora]|uniref:Uncharacterized protein n=1 Tax=Kingdonia uniflora TaxID=39325 RepID=A0A7J7M1U4_9MAGN|nr:hypothetical protein GIB67_014212 [Kingdonia uniflora]